MEPGVDEGIAAFIQDVYGIVPRHVEQLTLGLVNESYLVAADDGKKYVFRSSREKLPNEVGFEIEILLHLESKKFMSPRVVTTKSGEFVALYQDKAVVIFLYTEGAPAKELSIAQLSHLGGQIARMHLALQDFKSSFSKPTWEPGSLVPMYEKARQGFLDIGSPDAIAVVQFCDEYIPLYGTDLELPKGMTHQDIKRDNIIVAGNEIKGIIDFDNAYYGTLLYDFLTAVMWEGYSDDELSLERVRALTGGYQQVRAFTAEEKDSFAIAFRARIVREVFIGPFAALQNKDFAMQRAGGFTQKFHNFDSVQEGILLASIYHE